MYQIINERKKDHNMIKPLTYLLQSNAIPVYVVTSLALTGFTTCFGTINTIERLVAYCKTRVHVYKQK